MAVSAREAVYVHCRAGIGRSGLIAGAVMLHLGYPPESIFSSLRATRGVRVPDTEQQADWLRAYALSGEV